MLSAPRPGGASGYGMANYLALGSADVWVPGITAPRRQLDRVETDTHHRFPTQGATAQRSTAPHLEM